MHPLDQTFDVNPHKVTRVLIETEDGVVLDLSPRGADQVALHINPDALRDPYEEMFLGRSAPFRPSSPVIVAHLALCMGTANREASDPAVYAAYQGATAAVLSASGTVLRPPQST